MKAEMRNRIREYLVHTERRNAGVCIYNKTKICPWEDKDPDNYQNQARYKYKCQDEKNYEIYYPKIDEILEKNPHLIEILGTELEDTNPDIIAESFAKKILEATTKTLIEVVEEDNAKIEG